MGATVDTFKTAHQAVTGLLELVGSSKGQQRIDALNDLKEAVLAHIKDENSILGNLYIKISLKIKNFLFLEKIYKAIAFNQDEIEVAIGIIINPNF